MADYVDRTAPAHEHYYHQERNSLGWVIGLIALIVLGWLIFAYGLPALNRVSNNPGFTVPSQIDVNINRGTSGGVANPAPQPAQ
jgi:hypothetical protein